MPLIANRNNATIKRCCFCKYWYDPTNSAIKPMKGKDLWEVVCGQQAKYLIKNCNMYSQNTCSKFECKIP